MNNIAALAAAGAGPAAANTRTPLQKLKNELASITKEILTESRKVKKEERLPAYNDKVMKLRVRQKTLRNQITQLQRNETRKALRTRVPDYIVVRGSNVEDFQISVMERLSQGYVLQGGVSAIGDMYAQALVKNVEPPVNLLSNNVELLRL